MISLQTLQRKWASSRLEGRTSWIFSSCGWCSRLTTGTSGTRSGGLRKGQSTCELLGGLSGFLYHRCRGLRPCVESVPEPEDSSAVLTWILGYFWSLPRGVSPRLSGRMHVRLPPELWQQCHASLRLDQGICGFPTREQLPVFTLVRRVHSSPVSLFLPLFLHLHFFSNFLPRLKFLLMSLMP